MIDETRIRENFRTFESAFSDADIYFAAKANWNLSVLRILAPESAGADVFSDGELYAALLAGIQRFTVSSGHVLCAILP